MKNIFIFILRIVIGALLVVTGVLKIGHAGELAASIAGFRLVGPAVVAPLAVILPFFEVLLGGYLLAGLFTRIAAATASVAFIVYAAVIASAVLRHIPANCGCFGPNDRATADWPHVLFDLILAGMAGLIALWAPGAAALDRRFKQR